MRWTKVAKNLLLYLETCAVDQGGKVEARRMNAQDFECISHLADAGLIRFERIGARRALSMHGHYTHWVELTPDGWEKAHELRRDRAQREYTDFAKKALEVMEEGGG